jgi:hypothetical protein
MNYKSSFFKLRRQTCWTKTRGRSAAIFNLHSSNLQHDTLQPQRVNTLNVLARCHFVRLNGTYTYAIWPGGV